MKKMSVFGMTAVLVALGLLNEIQADVILDEPNLEGNVGLTGTYATSTGLTKTETFGSGTVTVSWSGGSVSNPLSSADTDYALRADFGETLSLRADMYSFASSGARLIQSISGIPELEDIQQDKPRTLDLARESGRIRGTVSVANNSGSEGVTYITYMRMYSSAQASSMESDSGYAESYSGDVTDTTAPSEVIEVLQPMPALPNTRVYGRAVVRKARADGSTCDLGVDLQSQSVSVPLNNTVDVNWTIDQLTCPVITPPKTGNLQGNVELRGLDGVNAGIFHSQGVFVHRPYTTVYSKGPGGISGSYSISDIPVGSYIAVLFTRFKEPYSGGPKPYDYLKFPYDTVLIEDGVTTFHDISHSVGTLHGVIKPEGIWGLNDVYGKIPAYVKGQVQVADYADATTGDIDFVVPIGNAYLNRIDWRFYKSAPPRTFDQYYYQYYNSGNSPISTAIAEGDSLPSSGRFNIELATSAIDQGFYLADPNDGIKKLVITAQYDQATGTLAGTRKIELESNWTDSGEPTNGVVARLHGEPGCYKATAVAYGSNGGTYRKEFDFGLVSPQYTAAGYSTSYHEFSNCDNIPVGSVEFTDNGTCATTPGYTVMNVSNIGPRPPVNFSVYHGNNPEDSDPVWYVDVFSTLPLCNTTKVKVCLKYDPDLLKADENSLQLGHYICDSSGICDWEKIKGAVVDPDNNTICGTTPSFSIFTILEPLDQDNDGIFDSEDNCPETPNADQADLDNDGYGDACDSDIDGDGIVDDEDRCPWIASQNNDDLDGDGLGDICDDDIDGDEVANNEDNCPFADNANQVDFDSDGKGDACDLDDDNDGIKDSDDNCAGTQADVLIDEGGCSSAQRFVLICPPEAVYKNHGKYVSCIAKEAERQLAENLITEEQKDAAVSAAAQTDIGSEK